LLLRSLVLENFRQYRGIHRLNLPTDYDSDRNIILIGGLNGAGKTSILEALRLALFGRLNEDLWKHTSYKAFMKQCLNKQAAAQGKRELFLSVELDVGDVNSSTTLRIERRWRFSGQSDSVLDTVTLFSNDKEKLGFSQEEAELYIQERIPYGAAQFVFFDGEKIQDLARDDGFPDDTREAIYSILGLQVHQELEHDMFTYERTLLREHANSEEFKLAEQSLEKAEKRCLELQTRRAALQRDLVKAEQRHAEIQSERKRLGNRQLRDRMEIDETLATLRKQREEVQKKLVELLSYDLPMVLMRPLLADLKARLLDEAGREQTRLVRSLLLEKREQLLEAYLEAQGGNPAALNTALEQVLGGEVPPTSLLHANLTIEQKYNLISRIDAAGLQSAGQVESVLRDLDTADHRYKKVLQDKRALPTDAEELRLEEQERTVMDQMRSLASDLGALQVEERQAATERAAAKRSYDMAEQKAELSKEIEAKVLEAKRIREALSDFIRRLGERKSEEVGRYLTRMFLNLARKEGFVQEFTIKPESFAVEMTDGNGNPIDLKTMSAGEKEVFAISFLWALGKAAVQELPMVIDTPLGRLDSVHRGHIAERFLPHANRQVLVLSTDTEIDGALYRRLTPYIAAAFRLEFDMNEQTTSIVPGYFFDQEVENKHVS
jgi:DNA sulfur modification protein DndD